jgi:hypothetical protein
MKRRKYNKYNKNNEEASAPVRTEKGDHARKLLARTFALSGMLQTMSDGYDYHTCANKKEENE